MKALFIGAHNDDVEYGCGGLSYILAQKGFKSYFLNVACKRRVYEKYPDAGERRRIWNDNAYIQKFYEQDLKAASVLGAEKIIIGNSDDSFYECNNNNIYLIKNVLEDIQPDIAFIPWVKDNHSEHSETAKAAFQALSYYSSCEVHAFEAGPWQTMVYFYPDFLINIEGAIEKMKKSLLVFDQPTANGKGLAAEKEKCAGFRGHMAGFRYAEAYKMLRFPPISRGPELMLPKLLKDDFRWAGTEQYPWGSQYFK